MHIEEFIWLYFSSRTSLSMLVDGCGSCGQHLPLTPEYATDFGCPN
jgi:predicted RNA-binding Zn-ribbon protein involved in translation (DUF1610 family)